MADIKRYRITHQTLYEFSDQVQLLSHTLRLRPREGHELRIEAFKLDITPKASLRWHRDAEGNSVATANFNNSAKRLCIKSEVIIQHYDLVPYDFLVADYAVNYPFQYSDEEKILLSPYMNGMWNSETPAINSWVAKLWMPAEQIQTVALLLRINQSIYRTISYRKREEEGVQTADQTLAYGTGSCRDSASLFMAGARRLGFACRFVSGYIYSKSATPQSGSTHAWAEVFIPGAGWKGFDPTIGSIVGAEHIPVAVARSPESVPPVSGKYFGALGTRMKVDVLVEEVV